MTGGADNTAGGQSVAAGGQTGDQPSAGVGVPRRRTLFGVAGTVGAAALLSACGDDSDSDTGSANGTNAATPGSIASGEPTSNGGGATPLAKTADIPVGGGKVFTDQKVVVTQPAAGEFKAFSSICTHAGCAVSKIADGVISCPCHGSQFSATDGSVKQGPASKALPAKTITVQGDSITLS